MCPVDFQDTVLAQVKQAFEKILTEMVKRGTPYHGFLFAGFMLDAAGHAWLLELNSRLGDPEAQVSLPGLEREFTTEVWRTARRKTFLWPERSGTFFTHDACKRVFVVAASPEYPESNAPRRGVEGIPVPSTEDAGELIPSAVEPDGTTTGGRILGALGSGRSIGDARRSAYALLEGVTLREGDARVPPHFRRDIGREFCVEEGSR